MNAPNSNTSRKRIRIERELRGWSQQDLAEKVGTTQKIVSRWERGESTPLPYYRQKLSKFLGKNAAELGLIDQEEANQVPDLQEEKCATNGTDSSYEASCLRHTNYHFDGNHPFQLFIPNDTTHSVTIQIHPHRVIPTSSSSEGHGIIDDGGIDTSEQKRSGEIEHIVKRREFIQEGLRFAGTTALTPYNLITDELVDRFVQALKKPSSIDERTLQYLELRTESYWQDRHRAALASHDLLSYVIEHLQKVLILLEGSLFPTIRTRLCCITSGIAQLAGHLLFDMGEFAHARKFHHIAITAAQEGNQQPLEAVAWGRMSFTWTYSGNISEALRCIQEARHLAAGAVNIPVQAYLAVVEAEIQAILGSAQSCLKALEVAECV
jgi:transcriptional regulator with XRE-family HTH domain